jgi:hypothetical protein
MRDRGICSSGLLRVLVADDAHCADHAIFDSGGNPGADCGMRSIGMAETRYGFGDT